MQLIMDLVEALQIWGYNFMSDVKEGKLRKCRRRYFWLFVAFFFSVATLKTATMIPWGIGTFFYGLMVAYFLFIAVVVTYYGNQGILPMIFIDIGRKDRFSRDDNRPLRFPDRQNDPRRWPNPTASGLYQAIFYIFFVGLYMMGVPISSGWPFWWYMATIFAASAFGYASYGYPRYYTITRVLSVICFSVVILNTILQFIVRYTPQPIADAAGYQKGNAIQATADWINNPSVGGFPDWLGTVFWAVLALIVLAVVVRLLGGLLSGTISAASGVLNTLIKAVAGIIIAALFFGIIGYGFYSIGTSKASAQPTTAIVTPTQPLSVQKTEPKHWTISYPTNQLWVDTGIAVQKGQQVSISVSGSFLNGKYGNQVGPEGIGGSSDSGTDPISGIPMLASAAKVDNGSPVCTGTPMTFCADSTGNLFLGTADDCPSDNQGNRVATITIK